MKIIKKIAIGLGIYFAIVFLLFGCNVIWTSPSHYNVKEYKKLDEPIMDMVEYESILNTHERPYIYSITSKKGGSAYIIGVDHTKDKQNPQLQTIQTYWDKARPTVALVEGRLGFLFIWFQNPIEKYGESGLVSKLAKKNGAELFTWEPTREDQLENLLKEYPADKIALFYSFRPYFSNMRYGKPSNPEAKLEEYLKSRTDNEHLKNSFQSWEELDSVWQKDFPDIEWRNYSDQHGWADGYLSEIANFSNLSRDFHLIQAIVELVENGETVFITMGVSHAPRIEDALRSIIK